MGVFTSIKALCHAGLAAWHLYLPKKMVEAGGVEPPSESTPTVASTRIVSVLILALSLPETGCLRASLNWVSLQTLRPGPCR